MIISSPTRNFKLWWIVLLQFFDSFLIKISYLVTMESSIFIVASFLNYTSELMKIKVIKYLHNQHLAY